jgi:hypothetical protein
MTQDAVRRRQAFKYMRSRALQKTNPRAQAGPSKAELRQLAEMATKNTIVKVYKLRRRRH